MFSSRVILISSLCLIFSCLICPTSGKSIKYFANNTTFILEEVLKVDKRLQIPDSLDDINEQNLNFRASSRKDVPGFVADLYEKWGLKHLSAGKHEDNTEIIEQVTNLKGELGRLNEKIKSTISAKQFRKYRGVLISLGELGAIQIHKPW